MVQDHTYNARREMDTKRKNQRKLLAMKSSEAEIKIMWSGPSADLIHSRKKINEFEDKTIEITQTGMQR
jgi:hypothetical protein